VRVFHAALISELINFLRRSKPRAAGSACRGAPANRNRDRFPPPANLQHLAKIASSPCCWRMGSVLGVAMRRLGTPLYAGLLGAVLSAPTGALADEGGVSFWLPGLFGSLAAAPLQPGWSLTAMEFYDSVKAGGDVALAREVQIGRFTPRLNVDINASLHSRIDLGLLIPNYTFEQRFLGAQVKIPSPASRPARIAVKKQASRFQIRRNVFARRKWNDGRP
jgi:hypothetical protein